MAGFRAAVLIALLYGCFTPTVASNVTPIAKVLSMMQSMIENGRKEKEDEAVKFAAFKEWCGGQTVIKKREIGKGNDRIEMLKAKIGKAEAHISSLTERINELDEDVGRWNTDKAAAADVRGKEKADYQATATDYTETNDAIAGAIATLKKQQYNRAQAEESFMQVKKAKLVPDHAKRAIEAFLQTSEDPDGEWGAANDDRLTRDGKEAHAYEFQSGGVVEMLEKLRDEFATKKRDLDKEELNNQHNYDLMDQTLTDSIEHAENEISKKKNTRGETQQAKSDHESDLASTTNDRDEDQKYLDEMTILCQTKSSNFESRQKLRTDELAAIQQALDIIGSKAVESAGVKHLPQLLQTPTALAQLRANARDPIQDRLAAFISQRATTLNSKLLAMVSQRVATDPFTKVKKMIWDLVNKLKEEATSEAEHKGWCDSELATNKQTRDSRTADVNELTAEIESLDSEIAQLGSDIARLASEVEELTSNMADADDERTKDKATNEKTIEEAKAAQAAVSEAISVLKEFYAKSSQATVFEQQRGPADDAPETFDAPYKGQLPEGGNIVDFLEVVLSDFSRLEAETTSSEASAADTHKEFIFEGKKNKALKENESGHKQERKTNQESRRQTASEDLKTNQEQLDKANKYYEKLKPSCVDSGITYEERITLREQEILSLQEALTILKGTDIA